MSEGTKIQWCDDTANFWRGCTKVSAGCAHCYAEVNIGVKMNGIKWGKGQPRVKSKSAVEDCLRWNKLPFVCDVCGKAHPATMAEGKFEFCMHEGQSSLHRRRVFSLSLGDWLDPEVPIEWLAEMLDTIRRCDQLTFILCTKRPELFNNRINAAIDKSNEETAWWLQCWDEGKPPKNVILLTSVENQQAADERIPALLKIPAVCHGLSMEPLLEAVNLPTFCNGRAFGDKPISIGLGGSSYPTQGSIDWLIIGGESGPSARPCNVDWIRSLVCQGTAAGVATFVKQFGAKPVYTAAGIGFSSADGLNNVRAHWNDPKWMIDWNSPHNRAPKVTDKKGGDISEFPADLRVREFPKL